MSNIPWSLEITNINTAIQNKPSMVLYVQVLKMQSSSLCQIKYHGHLNTTISVIG